MVWKFVRKNQKKEITNNYERISIMRHVPRFVYYAVMVIFMFSLFMGCGGPRFSIVTSTNMGLNANSGDGNSRPPQVSVGYKRVELALVPTNREPAVRDTVDPKNNKDAFSSLAGFHFDTEWFGKTSINQFISTGFAAQDIADMGTDTAFLRAAANAIK